MVCYASAAFRRLNVQWLPGITAGGSEFNLKDKQGWALYPANSIFISGYLTTEGQSADHARDMIHVMGFEVE
ncbi:MAG: hypothetical protein GY809_22285 [Planctomycetes bacterium]|nr:hypothetical protein [Planctomycetota bacterium]